LYVVIAVCLWLNKDGFTFEHTTVVARMVCGDMHQSFTDALVLKFHTGALTDERVWRYW